MNRFQYRALCKQFPAIGQLEIVRRFHRDCESFTVTRTTRDFLMSTPKHYRQDGSCVGIDERDVISFVLTDGTLIEDAVWCEEDFLSHAARSEPTYFREGETVIEAIDRHGVADRLAYIIRIETGYDVVGHYSTARWRGQVVKPAKGFTWADVIAQEARQAEVRVAAEIEQALGHVSVDPDHKPA